KIVGKRPYAFTFFTVIQREPFLTLHFESFISVIYSNDRLDQIIHNIRVFPVEFHSHGNHSLSVNLNPSYQVAAELSSASSPLGVHPCGPADIHYNEERLECADYAKSSGNMSSP